MGWRTQELGKKNEEFKQAEAKLQQRFAVEVAALNAKLAAAVDDKVRHQKECSEFS
jgi:vacuolar-type H+-ATPase subunit F/Vma7